MSISRQIARAVKHMLVVIYIYEILSGGGVL
jgi:hypothetical protein